MIRNETVRKSGAGAFYHGFVLGLIVDLAGKYHITSNRESGFGRYDVVMEPLQKQFDAIVMEFKVQNPAKEESLQHTVQNALLQIEERTMIQNYLQENPKIKGPALWFRVLWKESPDWNR
ncbi:MAG: PD-(D/E)XK nuclease domain-containing protein [Lachnospiraceae bacterium]